MMPRPRVVINRLAKLIHCELGVDLLDGTMRAHRGLAEAIRDRANEFGLVVAARPFTQDEEADQQDG